MNNDDGDGLGMFESPDALFDKELMAFYKAQKELLSQNLKLAHNASSNSQR